MSRICGVAAKKFNLSNLKVILTKMTSLLKHEDWHRVDEWTTVHVGLGHTSIGAVNLQEQPIFNEDKTKAIVWAGKIFGYEKIKEELLRKGHKFQYPDNDAEFVLHFYEEYGTSRFKELNGIFSLCIWDSQNEELILANDRHGMRPLYYYFDEGQKVLLFASEIKAIARQNFVNRQVNWDAWNVFLRLGFLIGEDTFYKNIHTLPQAGVLKFNFETINLQQYWSYNEIKLKNSFDPQEDFSILADLLKQAIKRRVIPGQNAAVFLSGGLDSRGIAAELKRQNVPFKTFTTQKFTKTDKDRKLAAIVAQSLGVENQFIGLPEDFLETKEEIKNYFLDFESVEHAWMLPMLDNLPKDIKINYDGLGNDTLCEPYLYVDQLGPCIKLFEAKRYSQFITECFIPKIYSYLPWKEGKDYFEGFAKEIQQKFSKEVFLKKVVNEMNHYKVNPFVSFQIASRTRRVVALSPFQLLLNKVESFCPYLDNDYFDFVMSLPMEAKYNLNFRKRFFEHAYQEISPIENLSKLKVMTDFDKQRLTADMGNYYRKKMKLLNKMAGQLLSRMNKGIYNPFYFMPKLVYAGLLGKALSLFQMKSIPEVFQHNFSWLIAPFYHFDNWLTAENISKDEMAGK